MFPIDPSCIDKSLPVPVGQQLYGLLAYAISHGDMRDGERLPSVRDMADTVGLATMTVNKVYKDLSEAGLINVRRGLGAYVARTSRHLVEPDPGLVELRRLVDGVIAKASALSISRDALMAMINTQMQVRRLHVGLRLVFVGVFEGPTRDYVEEIRPFLAKEDWIDTTTLEALRADAGLRRRCSEADAVLTFLHRQAEVEDRAGRTIGRLAVYPLGGHAACVGRPRPARPDRSGDTLRGIHRHHEAEHPAVRATCLRHPRDLFRRSRPRAIAGGPRRGGLRHRCRRCRRAAAAWNAVF